MKEFIRTPSLAQERSMDRNPSQREKIHRQIPLDALLEHYYARRTDGMPHVVEKTIRRYPTLVYLLGTSSEILDLPRIDDATKGIEEIRIVTEGAGMFGLKDSREARRWRGIFNHSVGSTANAMFLAEKMKHLTKEGRAKAKDVGFDFSLFDATSPKLFRDGWLLLHIGRRRSDETAWYGNIDAYHTTKNPYESSMMMLERYTVVPFFKELMSVEKHGGLLTLATTESPIPVETAVMVIGDWTFGQSQMTLKDRFTSLRVSRRESPEVLDALEAFGTRTEGMLQNVLGDDIFERMRNEEEPIWASRMKRAYAGASESRWEHLV